KKEDGTNLQATTLLGIGNNELFVGTATEGIVHIKNHKIIDRWDAESGLKSNTIRRLKLNGKILTVITSKGISLINLHTGSIENRINTTITDNKNLYDAIRLSNIWWIASGSGLLKVPDKVEKNSQYQPKLYLKSFIYN